ncbi:MAG: M20/M25/M40 family metallo-hydrolase [Bryobacterales bacterium]|nr:M20/M25/M40 family metallo-hydrolase [Bryobacterales bacterium]
MGMLALLGFAMIAAGQDHPAARAAREYRMSHERAIVDEFLSLLAIPNVASHAGDIARNVEHLQHLLAHRRIESQVLEVPNAPPVLYAEIRTPGATRTLMFYAHIDGQPVEPAQWQGSKPFTPVLKDRGGRVIALPEKFDPESRIYARSASDDKAPVMAMLAALDAMKAKGLALRSNLKFFFDGEEEAGSPNLRRYLEQYRDKLGADAWIFCDGPVHQSRKQQVVMGVRGVVGLNLTLYGAKRELHSGHYGNWAPNPLMMAAQLMASMRNEDGRILIPGFYDDVEPLSESEKQAVRNAPDIDAELKEELGLVRTEGNGKRIEELVNLPALNFRGMQAAGVGAQSRNVVPASTTISIDVRLVKGMDPQRVVDKFRQHLASQGYHVVTQEPDDAIRRKHPRICRLDAREGGYKAVRASMDLPISKEVIAAVKAARGDIVVLPTMGGSLPIAPIAEAFDKPVIIVPIANHDNNQHGHNENIRIQNLWDGIETLAALLNL